MKTRINVAVRMRPLLDQEISQGDTSQFVSLDEPNSAVKYIFSATKFPQRQAGNDKI